MGDRLYGLRPYPKMPCEITDIGHLQQISGLLFQGEDKDILLVFPDGDIRFPGDVFVYQPTESEWTLILHHDDQPYFQHPVGRVWLKKSARSISGKVQQIIWARDNFSCMYCGRKMGDVQLTVDHFVPLELGGWNDERNYISACTKCNKAKGRLSPEDWCRIKKLDYQFLTEYLMKD